MLVRNYSAFFAAAIVLALCGTWSLAQTLKPRPPAGLQPAPVGETSATPTVLPMNVVAGVPIKVVLDSEVRVRSVGQPVHGKTAEPVYVFDKLLIPAGAAVNGKISAIDPPSGKRRALDATDGNFSPDRHVHVEFDELVMPDGQRLPLQTVASLASDGVLQFVSADQKP